MNFSIWGLLLSRLKEVTLSYPKSVYVGLYLENLSFSLILSQGKFVITLPATIIYSSPLLNTLSFLNTLFGEPDGETLLSHP